MTEHPAPWWFRLAARLFPGRVREIPEAQNPSRIVLRQFALIKRHLYLQQFASAEDPRFMHSHQWRRTVALGLWGSYRESRIAGPDRVRKAPYFYTMDSSVVHHVQAVSPGHTSLFMGIGRDDSLKRYYGAPVDFDSARVVTLSAPRTIYRRWEKHIKRMVARI